MNEVRPSSKKRVAVLIKAAFEALDAGGGSLPLRDVKREVGQRVTLTEHDRQVYAKSGYVRWESVLHFYAIGEAVREARNGSIHIELMDLDRFLDQWMAHYDRMAE